MMLNYQEIGQRVRVARQEQGYTLRDLSNEIGISLSYLGHLERGTRGGSIEVYVALADCLHISLDYILRGMSLWEQAVDCYEMKDEQSLMIRDALRVLREMPQKWNAEG